MANNKIEKLIKFNNFYELKTSDPFFVWNKLSDKKYEDDENEEDESEDDKYWGEAFIGFEEQNESEDTPKYIEVQADVFRGHSNAFIEYIQKKYGIENVYIVKSKRKEEAIIETQKIIQSNKYKIILFPVFKYLNAISSPTLFDTEEKKVSNLKLSSSTKIKDYLRAYWDFWISQKALKFNLENYSMFLVDLKSDYLAKEIAFIEVFNINTGKTKRNIPKKLENAPIEIKKVYSQQGLSNSELEANVQFNNAFANISSGFIEFYGTKKVEKIVFDYFYEETIRTTPNGDVIEFNPIDEEIEKMNLLLQEDPSELEKKISLFMHENDFAPNRHFQEILEKVEPDFVGYSGSIINKANIIKLIAEKEEIPIKQVIEEKFFTLNQIINSSIKVDKEGVLEFIAPLEEKDKTIIWYDFEGFSMPYPVLDGTLPYQQIVFQLSIKKTVNGKIVEEEDLVYDPAKIDENTFKEIIKKIYSNKAHKFVVYNKGYELTRIKEMISFIRRKKDKDESSNNANKYFEMYYHIVKNTVDLNDLFKSYSNKRKQIPITFIPSLKGFHSIKKIEKYITENKIKLEHLITPYKELEVQNGLMAMNKAISRYVGNIGDREWEKIKRDLKKYCANDVMAMIMVFDFVKYCLTLDI